ncbi:MAG TPA: carboxypeptidase-like regulatory domain-containing protein [Kofleriaceae bacterium]|nr:carboxypeptidase-like regulatory domain-containing protein [Kofleriaceae bacterium]
MIVRRFQAGLLAPMLVSLAAVGAVAVVATPAAAQIAAALGKPLPSPDLSVGTVSVRVVAGSAASPVVGTDVTLIVNDTPRVARTDSAGRATFPGLPAGATVVAKVVNEDKEEKVSEAFQIPDAGGMRVMLTTKPWQAGASGAPPFAGGGAGMPNPRQLSGEARPEQGDAPGTITVRVTYDDLKDTPEGVPVVLVGYAADDSVSYQVLKTDKAGRAQFTGLDRSSGTSYFAMTQLPRNGGIDRMTSAPMVLESQVGVRVILSGEKRDSKAPPVDDLAKMDAPIPTEPGKVRVVIEGIADLSSRVTLVDAETKKLIGEAKPEAAPPDPSRVQGGSQFNPDAKLPAGTLDVEVTGGPGQTQGPLKDIEVRVLPASSKDDAGGLASVTGPDGTVRIALKVTEPVRAMFTINGRSLGSQPFDLGKTGGKLSIRANWPESGRPEAQLDVGSMAGRVVYAEVGFMKQHYRSMPFQLVEGGGSKISVFAYPRVMFRFQIHSFVEDQLLAAQGRFEITNYAWAPYRASADGLVIPLPSGFKGGVVFDPDQNEVAVAAGEGFRIVRPIPPGGRAFHGGFSLPVDGGKADWALDLPYGAYDSELDIRQTPGLKVNTPANVKGELRTIPQGTFYVIDPITILPKQSMTMSVEGLPSPPAWRAWMQRIIGVLVVALMLGGVAYALFGKRGPAAAAATADREARRQRLLDELVQLEKSGGSAKRREQLVRELEELWL